MTAIRSDLSTPGKAELPASRNDLLLLASAESPAARPRQPEQPSGDHAWHAVKIDDGHGIQVRFAGRNSAGRSIYEARGTSSTVRIKAQSFEAATRRAVELSRNGALKPMTTNGGNPLAAIAAIRLPGTTMNLGDAARAASRVAAKMPLAPLGGLSAIQAGKVGAAAYPPVARQVNAMAGGLVLPPLQHAASKVDLRQAANEKLAQWSGGHIRDVGQLAEFDGGNRSANQLRARLDRYLSSANSIGVSSYKQLMTPAELRRLKTVLIGSEGTSRQLQAASDPASRLPRETRLEQGKPDPADWLSSSTRDSLNTAQAFGNKLAHSGFIGLGQAGEAIGMGVGLVRGAAGLIAGAPAYVGDARDLISGKTPARPGDLIAGWESGIGKVGYVLASGIGDLATRIVAPGGGHDLYAKGSEWLERSLDSGYRTVVGALGVDADSKAYGTSSATAQVVGNVASLALGAEGEAGAAAADAETGELGRAAAPQDQRPSQSAQDPVLPKVPPESRSSVIDPPENDAAPASTLRPTQEPSASAKDAGRPVSGNAMAPRAASPIMRAADLRPMVTQQDLKSLAAARRALAPAERQKLGDYFVQTLTGKFHGELPPIIDDVHSHEGMKLFAADEKGPGFGSYDLRYPGNRPSDMSDAEWIHRMTGVAMKQAEKGYVTIFPVSPAFKDRIPGSTGLLPDGTPVPDYYLGRDGANQTLFGTVHIRDGMAFSNEAMKDRYGNAAIVPWRMSVPEFEALIGRKLPQDAASLTYVSTIQGCELHFNGPEIDQALLKSHATLIQHERATYGSNVIADKYILGLTSGNPRAEGSANNVFESLGSVNSAEQKAGIEPGAIKVLQGETNLSKEIVHQMGGQSALPFNGPGELANLNHWAKAMGEAGMQVIIHCDSGTPAQVDLSTWGGGLAAMRMPSNLENIEPLVKLANDNTGTDIIWAHAGLGYTVEMPAKYVQTLQSVLDRAPNIKIDISWDAIHRYIAQDPAAWAKLIHDNEDRLIFGSDTIATSQNPRANSRLDVAESLKNTGLISELDKLDTSLKERLFSGNFRETVLPATARANAFRIDPENRAWLDHRGYEHGEPAPRIWLRDAAGHYLPQMSRNPVTSP